MKIIGDESTHYSETYNVCIYVSTLVTHHNYNSMKLQYKGMLHVYTHNRKRFQTDYVQKKQEDPM